MKNLKEKILCFGCLVFIAVLTMQFVVWAANTGPTRIASNMYELVFIWTSEGNGTYTESSTNPVDGYLVLVVTDPDGTSVPTDNYDITLTDDEGVDVMGGALANRDTANTEQALPKIATSYGGRWVNGLITLNIESAGNATSGEVILTIQK